MKTSQGKTYKVQVPWGRMGSGFTLLMEAQLLMMSRAMPVAGVSRLTNVTQPQIWRLIRAHVKALWEAQDWSSLKRLGVDETSKKKGHCYGTAFMEIITEEAHKGGGMQS